MMLSKIVKSLASKDTVSVLEKIRNNEIELVDSNDELLNEFFAHHYAYHDASLDQREVAVAEFDDLETSVIQHRFLVIKKHSVDAFYSDLSQVIEIKRKEIFESKVEEAFSYALGYSTAASFLSIAEPVAQYEISDETLKEIELKASTLKWVNPRIASETFADSGVSWSRSILRDCAS